MYLFKWSKCYKCFYVTHTGAVSSVLYCMSHQRINIWVVTKLNKNKIRKVSFLEKIALQRDCKCAQESKLFSTYVFCWKTYSCITQATRNFTNRTHNGFTGYIKELFVGNGLFTFLYTYVNCPILQYPEIILYILCLLKSGSSRINK